jgi:hypothetical protein
MPSPKNGFYQWLATAAVGALCLVCLLAYQSIAGDVEENKKHVQTQDGMRLDERLCDLEKGVGRLEKAQIVMHGEKKVDRALLNSIAAKLAVPPAPEVQPLPEASEEP